ncbi:hypothetical protein LRP49_07465 [Enterovibrio sp. ZSDZ35]|uniref:DUF4434 domain-containing protein n=2 Tax=Enterovibrio qingdaonensis TaxID=2899818 RepID=A0ABT5QJK1_9GAMM|nr:DUF4434 domain-containing protein [Enterovibrio sp. ZSDZ35]MDD1781039.1 hypothetical protein [Enterovibrio sp. ZSDZ35]
MDEAITDTRWKADTHYLHNQGVSAGVVQWTQYGDETFGGETGWLAARLNLWMKTSPLWLGLYSDPNYFSLIDVPADEQYAYLNTLLQKNRNVLANWQPWIDANKERVLGIYLPFELSDYYFQSAVSQHQLNSVLATFVQTVDYPVAISVFINGAMDPDTFADWLVSIQKTGVKVWLQNGRGTDALSQETIQRYMDVLPCDVGIIDEIFHQESASPFKARPMTKTEKQKAQITAEACHPHLTFSFRYWRPMPFPLPIP